MDGRNSTLMNRIIGSVRSMSERLETIEASVSVMRNELNDIITQLNGEVIVEDDTTSPFNNDYMGNFIGDFNGNMMGTINANTIGGKYVASSDSGVITIPTEITVFELKGQGADNLKTPRSATRGQILLILNTTASDTLVDNTRQLSANSGKIAAYDGTRWNIS